jgi:hypothetical protein
VLQIDPQNQNFIFLAYKEADICFQISVFGAKFLNQMLQKFRFFASTKLSVELKQILLETADKK